jgi:hypothetical protein
MAAAPLVVPPERRDEPGGVDRRPGEGRAAGPKAGGEAGEEAEQGGGHWDGTELRGAEGTVSEAGRRGRERVEHGLRANVAVGRRRAMANARWRPDSRKEFGGGWRALGTVLISAAPKSAGWLSAFLGRDSMGSSARF